MSGAGMGPGRFPGRRSSTAAEPTATQNNVPASKRMKWKDNAPVSLLRAETADVE